MPMPSWAPDGRSVLVNAYGTSTAPRKTLRYLASGGGTGQTIASGQFIALATAPDGRHVLRSDMTTVNLVAVDSLRSPGMPIPGINALANFSPDGAWIACTSIAGSRSEVYVLPLAAQSARYRVSVNGGEEPRWSRDGRSIVYRYGTTWFEAAFTPGAPPVIGLPKKLFEGPFINVPGYSLALFPDGRHLLLRIANDSETHRLTAVTELARLLDGAARRP